eukprot:TRINITY_DN24561_c0_g1_i5.p2 TRINITY_DN24561_c0_g1~~TRINITY_DN24561_c0_g1_i5.p2  ORF type:complete len:203 (-),score=-13.25 TRINITY_DN24561_c0_g1_i5:148-756(-)
MQQILLLYIILLLQILHGNKPMQQLQNFPSQYLLHNIHLLCFFLKTFIFHVVLYSSANSIYYYFQFGCLLIYHEQQQQCHIIKFYIVLKKFIYNFDEHRAYIYFQLVYFGFAEFLKSAKKLRADLLICRKSESSVYKRNFLNLFFVAVNLSSQVPGKHIQKIEPVGNINDVFWTFLFCFLRQQQIILFIIGWNLSCYPSAVL